jgi:two-component system, chemotaxis family, sensor kinase CheA
MSDTTIQAIQPSLRLELDTLRDQRDLYRSLLLAEPSALGGGMARALETVERMRQRLRSPTRESSAFRGKIQDLVAELGVLEDALLGLHLPTVSARLEQAQAALRALERRNPLSGNDLLPALVVLEELCSHVTIAADCAAVHVPLDEDERNAAELEASQRRAQPKLAAALNQLAEKFALEQDKHVTLVTMGLEDIPEQWISTLFDALGQLLRNAIEHGIETPEQRIAQGKPELGTLVIEFLDRAANGFELNMQDDGQGLDAERIASAAVRQGILETSAVENLGPSRLVSLIFQPGLTTARDGLHRGQGMQIVRDHMQQLGGRIQVATKRGQFTRYRMHLPRLLIADGTAGRRA